MMLLYEVQEGDTPKSIALNAGVSLEAIAFANGFNGPRTEALLAGGVVHEGQFLHIPIVLCKADLRKLRDALKDK